MVLWYIRSGRMAPQDQAVLISRETTLWICTQMFYHLFTVSTIDGWPKNCEGGSNHIEIILVDLNFERNNEMNFWRHPRAWPRNQAALILFSVTFIASQIALIFFQSTPCFFVRIEHVSQVVRHKRTQPNVEFSIRRCWFRSYGVVNGVIQVKVILVRRNSFCVI